MILYQLPCWMVWQKLQHQATKCNIRMTLFLALLTVTVALVGAEWCVAFFYEIQEPHGLVGHMRTLAC